MDAGVQQNIQKATQGVTKDANARAVQLFETNYNIAKLVEKKAIEPINVQGADPQLQSSLNRLVEATRAATIAGNTKAANDKLKKNAASALQDVTTALGKTEQGSQVTFPRRLKQPKILPQKAFRPMQKDLSMP
jgi:hypothetical protein